MSFDKFKLQTSCFFLSLHIFICLLSGKTALISVAIVLISRSDTTIIFPRQHHTLISHRRAAIKLRVSFSHGIQWSSASKEIRKQTPPHLCSRSFHRFPFSPDRETCILHPYFGSPDSSAPGWSHFRKISACA